MADQAGLRSAADMARSKVRGPYAKSAARREQIIAAAIDLFNDRGLKDVSLREIAQSAGMSQAGLLHHFESRGELLMAVLAERDVRDEPKFRGRTHGLVVLDVLREMVALNATRPGLVRLFCELSAEASDPRHPAHEYFVLRYDALRASLVDAFANGQATGEVDPHADIDHAATAILAVQDGLQVQWLLSPELDMVGAFDAFLAAFRELLSGGSSWVPG